MKYTKIISPADPLDIGRQLNVHKTFRRRPGGLLNVLCTFNLRPVSRGNLIARQCNRNTHTKMRRKRNLGEKITKKNGR